MGIQAKTKNEYRTNLKNHLCTCIGSNFQKLYNDNVKFCKNKGRLDSYGFINQKENEVFQILNWNIMRSHPISEYDNEITLGMLKTKSISGKTLRKYILAFVENALSQDLPDKFGLLFDEWTQIVFIS